MSTKLKRIISLALSLTLLFSLCVPTYAANESNTRGVVFEVELDNATLQQRDSEQTVVMTLKTNQEITASNYEGIIVADSPISVKSIESANSLLECGASDVNLTTGKFMATTPDTGNATGITELVKVTLAIPANTSGSFNVGVNNIMVAADYGTKWETTATASTTLTIEAAAAPTDGYAAGISTITNPVAVDQTVNVVVKAQHSEDTQFAAGEVVLTYDSSLLTFNEGASALGAATVKDNAGTLTLEDYGDFKNLGDIYTVAFTAKTAGNAAVTLTSAKFIDKENAVAQDLIAAAISSATINVTVNEKTFNVTLPDIFEGDSVVTNGQDYTFTVTDGDNYTYTDVKATVDGAEVKVIDNGDGTYTVENVTGELVITATRTEKSYSVTFEGEGAEDAEAIEGQPTTATYNTDLTFTMPTVEGYSYGLDSITIGDVEYTGYSVENDVVTIPGTAITGDIVIEISKTDTEATVKVDGTGAGAAAGYETTAKMGESYTLTITPETGYIYTVTATMGGEDVELVVDEEANTYTIETVTGDIVFTVNREVVVKGVTLSEYLTVDGSKMWLVINEAVLDEGKTSTYNGANMFWSDNYGDAGAYCYLVVSDELTIDEAKANIGIAAGTATKLAGGMDVNKTGVVDTADAQLVHNMYNAYYNGFTTEATMEKFLEADVNDDKLVDVKDATAIINELLK